MKLQIWLIMLVGMMLFMQFSGFHTGLTGTLETVGIEIETVNSTLVSDGSSQGIDNSSLWNKIFGTSGILVLLAGGALIAIGLFARGYDPSLIYVPFIIFVATTFIGTFWSVIIFAQNTGDTWVIAIVTTLFIPMGISFAMACVDYFGNR